MENQIGTSESLVTRHSAGLKPERQPFWKRGDTFRYWALTPLILLMLAFSVYPVLQLFVNSVYHIELAGGELVWTYVGAENFAELLQDEFVLPAFLRTFQYVSIVVVIEIVLGLLLAFAVSRSGILAGLYRSVIIIPLLIPAVAIGTMWRLMFDYNYGVINPLISLFGFEPVLWTANPNIALYTVMIVDVWHWTGFVFLIMLAGVESIPEEIQESARVDGATELQLYRHIMIPIMRPTIIIALVLRTIMAFKVFDQIFVLTGGGPGTASQVISLYIHEVFSAQFRPGYASALSIVLALVMILFILFYVWLNQRLTPQEAA